MNIMKNYAKRRSFFYLTNKWIFCYYLNAFFLFAAACYSSFSPLLFLSFFCVYRLTIHIEVGVYYIVSKGKFNKLVEDFFCCFFCACFLLLATFSSLLFHYFVFNVSALFLLILYFFGWIFLKRQITYWKRLRWY